MALFFIEIRCAVLKNAWLASRGIRQSLPCIRFATILNQGKVKVKQESVLIKKWAPKEISL